MRNPVLPTQKMRQGRRREEGAILVISLLLLLVLTLLGVTAMQVTRMEERMAGNLQDANVAFQGAEAALRDGEQTIVALAARTITCPTVPCAGVVQQNVLPVLRNQPADWWDANARPYSSPGRLETEREPRFIVEEAAFIPDSLILPQTEGQIYYRVTAHSVGASESARAIVESTFTRRF